MAVPRIQLRNVRETKFPRGLVSPLVVIDEAKLGRGSRADLDVEGYFGGHVIMRKTDDERGLGRVPSDARRPHPVLRRRDAAHRERVFAARAKPVHLVDEKRVGEFGAFAHPLQARAALVKEVCQPVVRLACKTARP